MSTNRSPVVVRRLAREVERAQSTLEWVIGAAIILSTLAGAIFAWNQGLASKIGDLIGELTR